MSFHVCRDVFPGKMSHSSSGLYHRYMVVISSPEFDRMMELGQAVAGNTQTVYRFLQREVDESAANYLVGQFAFGDLTLAESLRTVELFQKQVMPKMKGSA